MNIWVPRTRNHWRSVYDNFGSGRMWPWCVTRHGGGCGSCTSHAMNSDTHAKHHWQACGGGKWYLRHARYSEPNGDYSSRCWLGPRGIHREYADFNDHHCNHCATSYLCSTNSYNR